MEMISPQNRLARFIDGLNGVNNLGNKQLIAAGIDFTEANPLLHVKWQPKDTDYQLVLIAVQGLDGFSVYRVHGDEELSEDEVIFEFEHDSDISKV